MDPAITVLLPVRNGAATLALALRSVLWQSREDFEVLVLDDGSTDESVLIARRSNDPRVRVISDKVGRGLSHRLNEGIGLARGRYVARMDADDVCFPDRFRRQASFLDAHPDVDLVGTRAIVFRSDGSVVGLLPFQGEHEALVARPWRGIPLAHPTWMGRREWFSRHLYRLPEVLRAEDQELLLRASATSRYACLDDVLLGYRLGTFDLRKTWVARRSLTEVQFLHHARRGEVLNAAKVLALAAARISLDLIASIPGCDRVFWQRMAEPAPAASRAEIARLLR